MSKRESKSFLLEVNNLSSENKFFNSFIFFTFIFLNESIHVVSPFSLSQRTALEIEIDYHLLLINVIMVDKIKECYYNKYIK